LNVIAFGLGVALCGPLAFVCHKVIGFVLHFVVTLVVDLLEGVAIEVALVSAAASGLLSLLPGMSKSFYKRIIKVVKKISSSVAKTLKAMKLSRLKAGVGSFLTGWEIGSAVGNAIKSGEWKEELIL
jgi:hypothetical protein